MSLRVYDEYEDSGIAWLGEVPTHWTLSRVSYLFRAGKGKHGQKLTQEFLADNAGEYPVYSGQTQDDGLMGTWNEFEFDFPGDGVLFSTTVGAKAMHLKHLSGKFSLSQNCLTLWPTDARCSVRFFYYHLQPLFAYERGKIPEHMQASFRIEDLYSYPICLPPEDEQKAISSFLDVETSKIDGLVSEQRRLIELLKEKRQAVISHAVTKGLNPNAPLKPSGIQWLGDVPQHWDAEMLSRVTTKIGNGFVGPTRDILVESGVPYIQATHIKRGRVNFDGAYFVTPEWAEWQSKAALQLDDVLIVQTGAGTGDIGLVSEGEVGYRCHALIIVRSVKSRLLGSFLSAALQSQYGRQTLESIQTGGMHPHLNCGNVKFVYVRVPPTKEQADIAEYVNERSAKFDSLEAEAERAIELLQERRTALISATVTGKIDVRNLLIRRRHEPAL